jgi:hypothetical protein
VTQMISSNSPQPSPSVTSLSRPVQTVTENSTSIVSTSSKGGTHSFTTSTVNLLYSTATESTREYLTPAPTVHTVSSTETPVRETSTQSTEPIPSLQPTVASPTEQDVSVTGALDLGSAVASVCVVLVLLVGGILSLVVVSLVMHYREWRGYRITRGRPLDRRSDSFRYTQSY